MEFKKEDDLINKIKEFKPNIRNNINNNENELFEDGSKIYYIKPNKKNNNNLKNINTIYPILILILTILLLIIILNINNVLPKYSIHKLNDNINSNMIMDFKPDGYMLNRINNNSNKADDNEILNQNIVTNNRLESRVFDICKSHNNEKVIQNRNRGLNHTIFFYNTPQKTREVGQDIFLTIDDINREYIQKVRLNKEDVNIDLYFRDESNYQFIVSLRSILNITGFSTNNININKELSTKKTISIILDDVGDNLNHRDFLRINYPLTFSIIPLREYSLDAAHEIALFDKHSILMHFPFESGTSDKSDVVTFYINDDDATIKEKLVQFINNVPFATGMNNHQGSKATSNYEFMDRFMKIFAKTNLYFIDSITTLDSVAYQVARNYNIKALKRDVFLDNKNDYDYIKTMLNNAIRVSNTHNKCVAIGHITKSEMLKILINKASNLNENNKFITTDQLVRLVYP